MNRPYLSFIIHHSSLGAVFLWLLAGVGGAVDWTSLGLDGGRTRRTAEVLPVTGPEPFSIIWGPVAVGAGVQGGLVTGDGFLFVGGSDGAVRAYRETDGVEAWTASVSAAPVIATPAVHAGRLFVATQDGYLRVLRVTDGSEVWGLRTGGNEESSPAVEADSGMVFLGSGFPNADLLAVDATTGAVRWEVQVGQAVYSSAALDRGSVFLGSSDGVLHRVNATTGVWDWSYDAGGAIGRSSPLFAFDRLFLVPGGSDMQVHAFDAATLAVEWGGPRGYDLPGWSSVLSSSPVAGTDSVYFAVVHRTSLGPGMEDLGNVHVFRVDPTDGSVLATRDLGAATSPDAVATPAVTGGFLVAGTQGAQSLEVLDLALDPIQSITLSGPVVGSPIVANGRIYVATQGGDLYALGGTNEPPAPPTDLSPDGGEIVVGATPELTWSASTDPDGPAGVTYHVRVDTDGEVLEDFDEAYEVTGALSVTLGARADGSHLYFAVRAEDANGALSAWSDVADFYVDSTLAPPQPPTTFLAAPADGGAWLYWGASPSVDVDHYEAAYRQAGSLTYGPFFRVASGTLVVGLTNGVAYDFLLRAVDLDGLESSGVLARVTPSLPVIRTSGGIAYEHASLAEALAGAQPGDRVDLAAGSILLTSTLLVPEDVTLSGAGALFTVLEGAGLLGAALQVEDDSGGGVEAMIKDLTITGAGIGIQVGIGTSPEDGARAVVRNVVLHGLGDGIVVRSGAVAAVRNATITDNTGNGISFTLAEGTIRNCIVVNNDGWGILGDAASAAATTATYNDVAENGAGDYMEISAGIGSISQAVTFRDSASGDYRVTEGEPTVDAGDPAGDYSAEPYYNGGRINQGAFGGTPLAAPSPVPGVTDVDGDGILDSLEQDIGMDPAALDTDGDGWADVDEIGVNPLQPLDSDDDGIPDALEPGSAAFDATRVSFVVSPAVAQAAGLAEFEGETIVLATDTGRLRYSPSAILPTPLLQEGDLTENTAFYFPHGLLDFYVDLDWWETTATITVTLPVGTTIDAGARYMKYASGAWSQHTEVSGLTDGDNQFVLVLYDGGAGDADGARNQIIHDPGGVALPVPSAETTAGSTTSSTSPGPTALPSSSASGSAGGCFLRSLSRD